MISCIVYDNRNVNHIKYDCLIVGITQNKKENSVTHVRLYSAAHTRAEIHKPRPFTMKPGGSSNPTCSVMAMAAEKTKGIGK
jgi:hypothetical protein